MLSRRTILKWMGAIPAGFAASSRAAQAIGSIDTGYAPSRVRKWKMVLEPDGSSSLMDGSRRWLDEWIKTQTPEQWNLSGTIGRRPRPANWDTLKSLIREDIDASRERNKHWQAFKEFQKAPGVKVEAEFYRAGAMLRNDPPLEQRKKLEFPVFQFYEKDW